MRVVSDQPERIQVGTSFLNVQRYDLLFSNPGGDLAVSLTAGDGGRLIRLSVPAQAIEVVREDVASPTSRTQVFSNPGDEAVIIPAPGFNLGATITKPAAPAPSASAAGSGAAGRMPASSCCWIGMGDRDGFVMGIPTLAQLAGHGHAGFLAVRYDKRGFGQSGGRSESATIQDSAEDAERSCAGCCTGRMSTRSASPSSVTPKAHGLRCWPPRARSGSPPSPRLPGPRQPAPS